MLPASSDTCHSPDTAGWRVVIDSSAVIATIADEPMAPALGQAIGSAPVCRIGAPTLVETTPVLVHKEGRPGKAWPADFPQTDLKLVELRS
jgi:uncharacterized protein with PIN domain